MRDLREIISNAHKVVGLRQVKRGLADGTVRCVVLCLDADAPLRDEVESAARAVDGKIHYFRSMDELGKLCGIDVRCAVLGFAEEF